jgi:dihydroxyacetone kinase-like protein
MKKIINQPKNMVTEMLHGIYAAHPQQVTYVHDDIHCYIRKQQKAGKVGIVTGGGSGHLPLFLGYVGEGLLDGCAIGEVFQSPNVEQIFEVTKAVNQGAGVLYIYGNYNGDIFNFNMAADMADMEEDIRVETVIGWDDVASPAPKTAEEKNTRRGVAGIFFIYKCAGAAARRMLPLEEVKRIAKKARDSVRTMGVALSACIVPVVGKPGFSIAPDEMELGMGIHGEPGIKVAKLEPADQITDSMLDTIVSDLPYETGDEVAVLVNGLGATPLEELYVIFNRVAQNLGERGIQIYRSYVGEFATSMEMAGASISLLKLDEELKGLIDEPANTPFFKQF